MKQYAACSLRSRLAPAGLWPPGHRRSRALLPVLWLATGLTGCGARSQEMPESVVTAVDGEPTGAGAPAPSAAPAIAIDAAWSGDSARDVLDKTDAGGSAEMPGMEPIDSSRPTDAASDDADAADPEDAAAPADGARANDVGDTPPPGLKVCGVLPLGDSITSGNQTMFSYRYWLWSSLNARAAPVNFVGSLQENFLGSPEFPDPAFDRDHEGHWGWRTDEILRDLPSWVPLYRPDIVLLHLGTNDCWQGQTAASTIDELAAIIDTLRARNARVAVLLAQILPTGDPGLDACIDQLNAQIPALAQQKNTVDSPIIPVDQHTGFDNTTDTHDGIHPNEAGEKKMARRWEDALLPALSTLLETSACE